MSMDGRGRVFDTIFVERLWRTVKYEHLYVYAPETASAVAAGLAGYFHFYNTERPHQRLDYRTPAAVHYAGLEGLRILADSWSRQRDQP